MTRITDPKTGTSALQCDECPDTFIGPEQNMDPRALKQLAEREAGWSASKDAGSWFHYCRYCTSRRKGRLL